MATRHFSKPAVFSAPLKVIGLACLPLLAGLDIGDPAAADPQGYTGALPSGETSHFRLAADDTFRAALAEGYRALSSTLEASAQQGDSASDWADSQYFTLRAMAAARGDDGGPEQLANWSVPAGASGRFLQLRADILSAREKLETAEREPAPDLILALAEAQVGFDCWIERSEEDPNSPAAAACLSDLKAALARYQSLTRQP